MFGKITDIAKIMLPVILPKLLNKRMAKLLLLQYLLILLYIATMG